ncbi:MAG: winged helix-turn-helix domain-containing protein [Acetobacteraceae bacterium]|nr:winged helix-turn-helix domain-containing protein [Acetobacteraceae bacterium]
MADETPLKPLVRKLLHFAPQTDIADALGLTPVHVNRCLQELRREKLLTLEHRKLVLHNPDALQGIAQLTKRHLHLGGAPENVTRLFEKHEAELAERRAVMQQKRAEEEQLRKSGG